MSWVRKAEWPWWQAGLALGLLNMFAFYTANYYLSVSTTFSRAAGMVVGVFAPQHVAQNPYWQMVKPLVDWQFMLVLGIPVGAWLAARLARRPVTVSMALPEAWVSRFGTSPARRWAVGLLGGVLVGFGARLADG
jgi:hypothetical protein